MPTGARKKSDRYLAKKHEPFEKTLDYFPYGIIIADQDGNIEFVNSPIRYEFGDPGTRKCYEYFHDLSEPCSWCPSAKVFQGETIRWNWHSPKNSRDYELVDIPLFSSDGTIISKLEVFKDVTAHKRTENALRESEEKFRILAENSADVIWSMDANLGFTYLSPAVE
ncbi:MAG: PAS domain-containing protein [Desulfohalobiaceae bacterium]|nr:PAS domain-containing protein [Desulfohalobiaceae bacterium]